MLQTGLTLGCVAAVAVFLSVNAEPASSEFLPQAAPIEHQRQHHLPTSSSSSTSSFIDDDDDTTRRLAERGDDILGSGFVPNSFNLRTDEVLAVSWRLCSLFPVLPLTALLVALITLPESPRWYLVNDQETMCQRALMKLRGTSISISEEFVQMRNGLQNKFGRFGVCDIFQSRALVMRCLICIILNVAQPLVGIQMVYLFADEMTDVLGMHSSTLVHFYFILFCFIASKIFISERKSCIY